MIFPRDINKRLKEKNKVAGENKVQLVLTVFILGNFFGFMLVDWLNSSFLGGGFWLTILFVLILNATVGVYVFRFFIFDENAKIRESQRSEGDSFAKYMKVRKDVAHTVTAGSDTVNVTEFSNGSMAFTIQFKFGSNDDFLAGNTKVLFQQLFKIAHMYGLETRFVECSEDFVRSNEYKKYADTLNRVKNAMLKNTLILLSEAVLKEHQEMGNVACVYFTVRSLRNFQRADLEDVLKNYIKIFRESKTAIRSIQFLDNVALVDFFTEFYGVGAIDLSTGQAIEMSRELNESFQSVMKLYSLKDEDGQIYRAQDDSIDKVFKLREKKIV